MKRPNTRQRRVLAILKARAWREVAAIYGPHVAAYVTEYQRFVIDEWERSIMGVGIPLAWLGPSPGHRGHTASEHLGRITGSPLIVSVGGALIGEVARDGVG